MTSLYKYGLKKDETIIERKKEIEKYRLNLIDLDSWKFIKKIDDNAHFYIIFLRETRESKQSQIEP